MTRDAGPGWRALGARIAALLLPQHCLLCGASSGAQRICAPCRADLPVLGAEVCPRCALPSPGARTCGRCLADPPRFDAARALCRYAFPVDRLVLALKFGGRLEIAAWFGEWLADELRERPLAEPPDLVVPLPLARERLAERGFNQAIEIARHAGRGCGWRVATGVLRRVRHGPAQSDLPLDERARNVRRAFVCDADLGGRSIALVDDVMTTGATLDEAAGMLRRAGARAVTALVIARTLPPR
jgi:ComF family protein